MTYKSFLIAGTALAIVACGSATSGDANADPAPQNAETNMSANAEPVTPVDLSDVPGGAYSLDMTHAILTASWDHAGMSTYTVRLSDFDADLMFDVDNPENSSITVMLNPMGIITTHPEGQGKADWESELSTGDTYLNGDEYPEVTFVSNRVEMTGSDTGVVYGDLTMAGTTLPFTFDVTFNGSGNMPWYGERKLIGFDAVGTFTRSEYGMTEFLPAVSDNVTISFSGEFLEDETPAAE